MSVSGEQQGESLDSGTKTFGERVAPCCFTKTWQRRVQLVCSRNRNYTASVVYCLLLYSIYTHRMSESPPTHLYPCPSTTGID